MVVAPPALWLDIVARKPAPSLIRRWSLDKQIARKQWQRITFRNGRPSRVATVTVEELAAADTIAMVTLLAPPLLSLSLMFLKIAAKNH